MQPCRKDTAYVGKQARTLKDDDEVDDFKAQTIHAIPTTLNSRNITPTTAAAVVIYRVV
jgi:hypothetical protein